jgi:hypothetical protein
MAVAAASCWSFQNTLDDQTVHVKPLRRRVARQGWQRVASAPQGYSGLPNPSGASEVPPPIQELHVTRPIKKSLEPDTLTAVMTLPP